MMDKKELYHVIYGDSFAKVSEIGNGERNGSYLVEINFTPTNEKKTFGYTCYNHACYKFDVAFKAFCKFFGKKNLETNYN